jgi:hypothetical protein
MNAIAIDPAVHELAKQITIEIMAPRDANSSERPTWPMQTFANSPGKG